MKTYPFEPDYEETPGATVQELIEEKEISRAELAAMIGLTPKATSRMLTGEAPLTDDIAAQLEAAFRVPASFWIAREASYRKWLAEQVTKPDIAEDEPTAVGR